MATGAPGRPTHRNPAVFDVTLRTPLDWAGVTGHSEYVGVIDQWANGPNSPVSKLPAAQPLRIDQSKPLREEGNRVFAYAAKAVFGGSPFQTAAASALRSLVFHQPAARARRQCVASWFSQ